MDLLLDGPDDADVTLLLAHGAGAAMDSPWMNSVAGLLVERGVRVARFEFAYMAQRRTTGKRGGQPRAEAVLEEYRTAVTGVGGPVVVGGKSFGGRVASMIADDAGAAGVVALGYPFHPPKRPDRLRTDHLLTLRTPMLIVQGERDPFGAVADVPGYGLPDSIEVHWALDGDHSLKPRRASGRTEVDNLADAADSIAAFVAVATPRAR
ncbi:alpha/beta family hydrolase [Aeromicrobium sp. CF3.5]|uniref:alpha/beta family hydrolase n=1 Tax=Aeromicrobium sp. CF3.5 TaxID=3373078 RepID=UPI003EE52189